ncbi:hypothetical protein L873DRAFT_1792072 [Choiromyces venosus 120613-1]|uniref:Uncharacterized protein n=1 Tax=Choiromyces venosus 120613-1 TaxID=1336337 RepID=A0A3N4JG46_9PEZI|nr:hypothetical protein L873DRAFT_1792072 [Choiromyces venosus 120613-1]
MKMPSGESLSIQIRSAIVTLIQVGGMSYLDVYEALNSQVSLNTIKGTWLRVKKRSKSQEIFSLLENVEDQIRPEPAVPQKIPLGSATSEQLQDLALCDEEHWQKTFPQIAAEAEVNISKSYAYKIMNEHHDLGRFEPQ